MWANGVTKLIKLPTFPTVVEPSAGLLDSACAVTSVASQDAPDVVKLPDSLLVDQLAGSQVELMAEQVADSLNELSDSVRGEEYCSVLFPPRWYIGSEVDATWRRVYRRANFPSCCPYHRLQQSTPDVAW